jgi:hypothetical protein
LRRLGRERVEFYLLHEPDLRLIATDEWLRWLEDERDRVAWFGIAGVHQRLAPFVETANPLATVIQTEDSITGRDADFLSRCGRPFQFTYGYVSALRGNGPLDAANILARALRRNRTGSVIVSTRKIDRLPQYGLIVKAAESGSDNGRDVSPSAAGGRH